MLPVFLNLLLAGLKFVGGNLSGSVSVTADALNNLTDALTSLLTALGTKVAALIGGKKHINGHGRIEWLVALIVSCSVVLVGWELLRGSVDAIISPEATVFHLFTLAALIVSVVVKAFLYFYNSKKSHEKNSQAYKAAAADCISDAVSTTAVIIALMIDTLTGTHLDGWCGLLVSLFIIYNGIKSFADTARRVMGEGTDENATKELRKYIAVFDGGFFGKVYDLQIIDYGYERYGAAFSVVPNENNAEAAIEKAAALKAAIYRDFGYSAVIGTELPTDERTAAKVGFELRQALKNEGISAIAKEIRVNRSDEKLQLIFRAEIPFEAAKKEAEITEKLKNTLPADKYEIIPKLLLGHSAKMDSGKEMKRKHSEEEKKDFMNYSETTYPFLEDDIITLFGFDKGRKIFDEAEELLLSYQENVDYRNSEMIQFHMQRKIFPLIAYYKTLRANGIEEEAAVSYARQESEKVATQKKKEFEKLGKLPFAYGLYRLFVKGHMDKNFPKEGWDTEWVKKGGKEIRFDFTRCIYHDLAVEKGCPELCTVFCDNDDISFSGLLPKIVFKRENTIGYGATRCDFHFYKGGK